MLTVGVWESAGAKAEQPPPSQSNRTEPYIGDGPPPTRASDRLVRDCEPWPLQLQPLSNSGVCCGAARRRQVSQAF